MKPSEQTAREHLSGPALKQRALDLLSRRDHSEKELIQKLRLKGAVVTELPDLLDFLKARGFLDDRRFAETFVRFRSAKPWGRNRYRQELLTRGVDSDIVAAVLTSVPEINAEQTLEKLSRLVKKELAKGRDEKKIMASFVRRGFSGPDIRNVLRSCSTDG